MKKAVATTPRAAVTPSWRQHLNDRLKEGALIAISALCLFLMMALLTYGKDDPGWSRNSKIEYVQNFCGLAGSYSADILFMALGYFAYIVPLLLSIKTKQIFSQRYKSWQWSSWLLCWRLIGLAFLVLSGTALAHIHFHGYTSLPAGVGGALGKSLGDLACRTLNIYGSTLMFIAILMFGFTLFIDLSWFKVMDMIGKIIFDLLKIFQSATNCWWLHRVNSKRIVAQLREADTSFNEVLAKSMLERCMHAKLKKRFIESEQEISKYMLDRKKYLPPVIVQAPTKMLKPNCHVQKEKQTPLSIVKAVESTLPSLSILDFAEKQTLNYSPKSLVTLGHLLESKLKEFGIEVSIDSIHPGPVVTSYEIQPAAGVKVSRISILTKDLARSLAVTSVRVVEVIPSKTTVGIEIPNENRQIVRFSEVLLTPEYNNFQSPVTLALGHDIGGKPVIADLAKMPHLLVAGTTGSGKSVGVNAMILSILFKSGPDDAKIIMIDPKMLELSIYEGIPHLLCPVVTDMKDAINVLRWSVIEMERRYKLMAKMGVRNISGFNAKVKAAKGAGTPLTDPLHKCESIHDTVPLLTKMPIIVVVVDEFADMMMIVGKKVEELIARLAQKARAAGIHLILATQRPSVNVITGLIKANIPMRIAFQVSSKIDSRIIIDQGGAEQLLGHGDMLYMSPGASLPIRVHGAFVSDEEVHRVVEAWKLRGAPEYNDDILASIRETDNGFDGDSGS